MANMRQRPKIPDQTQRELWARAAGRCEFRGCNELLYRDGLTQHRSNLAIISHIVSFSPDGPRGDQIRSTQLEKDIRNLILTCRDHGKIVDDKALEAAYPEDLLQEFKREHEARVRMLTEITADAQTHVLLLQASIDARDFEIDEQAAFRAILPKYPAEESARVIDLTGGRASTETDGFFSMTAASISEQTRDLLRRRPGGRRITTLSVFALAPVPLLVHFGHELGDIDHVDLYQRHRDGQDWMWKAEEEADEFYEVLCPETADDGESAIALVLSVSAPVGRDKITVALGRDAILYEIRAKDPSFDFLRSRKRLEVFGYEVRRLLTDLREAYGHDRMIHVFAATPAPVAIEFGRSIKDYDPPFLIYEYRKADRLYVPALTVNCRSR
ncbi:MAG: SAVED domain-containing protein [Thermomicrobiales bacterium]